MSLRDYQPTGREMEVLQFLKDEPEGRATQSHLSRSMGIAPDVIEVTLENLETVGCVRRVSETECEFVSDPAGF